MTNLNGAEYRRLQHAIALTRESLAIASELGDDVSAFQLKHALHSLHYISEREAVGHEDREPVPLTLDEATVPRNVKTMRETDLSDEQHRRLVRAIALARESLIIAVEMDNDLPAFHLTTALRSLDYSRKLVFRLI
jgi:hypothetical protein